jgi:hypothetical protein
MLGLALGLALELGFELGVAVAVGVAPGVAVGTALGTADGNGPPPPGGSGDAGIPPLVLHAETAAHIAAAARTANNDRSTRFMAQ